MEENKDISQIALEKIKESGIKPISKKIFSVKRVLFWSLVGFAILVGVVSFSITLSLLFNNDWYLYNKFGFGFILKSLPYFWFICLVLFSILGEFYYRKTLFGYRHRMITVVGIYVIITVSLGTILHLLGIGEIIEQSISDNVPVYKVIMFDKNEFWSHPDRGLLSGRIIEVKDNKIKIIDFNNNIWIIDAHNATVLEQAKLEMGKIIEIVGDNDNDDDGIFKADEIRPWFGVVNQNCCTLR